MIAWVCTHDKKRLIEARVAMLGMLALKINACSVIRIKPTG
jgi:hypothetical protein